MMITGQHQNALVWRGVAAELIKQRIELIVFQQRNGVLIANGQAVQRFTQLMWILLNEAVGNFANAAVKTVGRIQRAVIALAKIVVEAVVSDSCAPLKR